MEYALHGKKKKKKNRLSCDQQSLSLILNIYNILRYKCI